MPFVKGKSGNLSGRPGGVANKITADIRKMIRGALDAAGGQEYLVQQASENPVAFMGLVGKIVPTDVKIEVKDPFMALGVQDLARLIVTFSRSEGFTPPVSVLRLAAPQAGDISAIQETEGVS